MVEYFQGLPYPIAVALLFVVVVLRAGASYALGRGAQAGAHRTRLRRILDGERFRRTRAVVDAWGAPVVALSFLTIGFQTVANVAAGIARMPLRRYVPALVVGGVAWAVLYATVGVLGAAGFTRLYAVSPVAAIVSVIGAGVAIGAYVVFRLHRRSTTTRDEDDHDRDPQPTRLAAHDRLP